jgi:hypothetical protein
VKQCTAAGPLVMDRALFSQLHSQACQGMAPLGVLELVLPGVHVCVCVRVWCCSSGVCARARFCIDHVHERGARVHGRQHRRQM